MKILIGTAASVFALFVLTLTLTVAFVPKNVCEYLDEQYRTENIEETILSDEPERARDITRAFSMTVPAGDYTMAFVSNQKQSSDWRMPVYQKTAERDDILIEGFVISPVDDRTLARRLWQVKTEVTDTKIVFTGGKVDIAFLKLNNYVRDFNQDIDWSMEIYISYAVKITYPQASNIYIS